MKKIWADDILSLIRPIPLHQMDEFVSILSRAYPGMGLQNEKKRELFFNEALMQQKNDESMLFYGTYEDNELVGGMCTYDFEMNMLSVPLPACGIGYVAVDLHRKREHLCKDMMSFFLEQCRSQKKSLAMLYPFRPDFYHSMGFGHGAPYYHYTIAPMSLPFSREKKEVFFAKENDISSLADCDKRYMLAHHGEINRTRSEIEAMVKDPKFHVLCHKESGNITGYLSFVFKHVDRNESFQDDIELRQFVYTSQEAYDNLLSFLSSQSDQVRYISMASYDPSFYFQLSDIWDEGHKGMRGFFHQIGRVSTGPMYKIVDVAQFFAACSECLFGEFSCTVAFDVKDQFNDNSCTTTIVRFDSGYPTLDRSSNPEVTVYLDIASLSAMCVGAVKPRALARYGKLSCDKSDGVDVLEKIFGPLPSPQCTKVF